MDILGDTRDIDILMTKIGSLLSEFSMAESSEKEKISYDIKKKIKSVRLPISLLRIRIGTIIDPNVKSVYMKYLNNYITKIDQYENILNDYFYVEVENNNTPLSNYNNAIHPNKNISIAPTLKNCAIINNETLETLERTEMIAHTTETIGNNTLNRLEQQREIIIATDSNLNNFTSVIDRVKKDIRWFVIHMITDRCIMILFASVLLCTIGVIIVHIYKSKNR